jgi:hypothetical protein
MYCWLLQEDYIIELFIWNELACWFFYFTFKIIYFLKLKFWGEKLGWKMRSIYLSTYLCLSWNVQNLLLKIEMSCYIILICKVVVRYMRVIAKNSNCVCVVVTTFSGFIHSSLYVNAHKIHNIFKIYIWY